MDQEMSNVFQEIAVVYNAANSLDNPDHMNLDGGYFEQLYSIPDVDITRDIVIVRDKMGRAEAFGALLPHAEKTDSSLILTMYVHPSSRRVGIGSSLLGSLIEGAKDRGVGKVTCNVPSFRPTTMAFLEKRGFNAIREWVKLVHPDINKAHSRAPKTELTYQSIERRDAGKWARLQNSLFKGSFNYREVTAEDYLRKTRSDTFCSELSLFGQYRGHTVAYCSGSLFGRTGSHTSEKRLIIDGIGVKPHFRRHGFGSSILNEVLIRAASMGVTHSELVVDVLDNPASMMYRAAGFVERYRRIWYERTLT